MAGFIEGIESCVIKQVKEWGEIIVGIETRNKYEIYDMQKKVIGYAAEVGNGFWRFIVRNLLRSHRPLEIQIFDSNKELLYQIKRPFFWLFSDLTISDPSGKIHGIAHRRFSFINKKYDLVDERGRLIATIKSPFWRLWQFPIQDPSGKPWGLISKKWGGVLKEVFTDADTFKIDFPPGCSANEKALILGTAFTIDLDFFEENVRRGSSLSWNN